MIIVIIPFILMITFNVLIYARVRSSSRRVEADVTAVTSSISPNRQRHGRDIHLLKHMIFNFIVHLLGWGPFYFVALSDPDYNLPGWIYLAMQLSSMLSGVIQIIDLFVYNRELRQYLKERLSRCLHLNINGLI